MKRGKNRILCMSAWFFCWAFCSCIEVVELENPEEDTAFNLVVDGLITDGRGPYEINIFRTTGRGTLRAEAVAVGEALVRDDEGNEEFLVQLGETIFQLEGKSVQGRVNHAYQIEFFLADGSHYLSDWEMLPPVSTIDSVYFETRAEQRQTGSGLLNKAFVDFYADISLDALPGSPYMRWETQRWWMFIEPPKTGLAPPPKSCFVWQPPFRENIKLFDGRGITADHWTKEPLGFVEVDWRFHKKTYFNFIQYSLNEQAFRYWTRLDQVIDQTGGIFDSPPAAVVGNVQNVNSPYEQVLGYFGASATDTVFRPIWRQDLPGFIADPCIYFYLRNQFGDRSPCDDCLVLPNSTLERPYYW
jgi:hypothetical protein